jgi:hypothetical protein
LNACCAWIAALTPHPPLCVAASAAAVPLQVTFPLLLDALDFCTPELQAELKGPRLAGKHLGFF